MLVRPLSLALLGLLVLAGSGLADSGIAEEPRYPLLPGVSFHTGRDLFDPELSGLFGWGAIPDFRPFEKPAPEALQVPEVTVPLPDRRPEPPPAPPPPSEPRFGRLLDEGMASWYGPCCHKRKTANGEIFDQWGYSAAMYKDRDGRVPRRPQTIYVVCKSAACAGKVKKLRLNDAGPFAVNSKGKALYPLRKHPTRVIDLSRQAMIWFTGSTRGKRPAKGLIQVEVYQER